MKHFSEWLNQRKMQEDYTQQPAPSPRPQQDIMPLGQVYGLLLDAIRKLEVVLPSLNQQSDPMLARQAERLMETFKTLQSTSKYIYGAMRQQQAPQASQQPLQSPQGQPNMGM